MKDSTSARRNSLRIRYNLPLPLLPVTCVCGQPNNLTHALQCQKGGFVNRRHDNIRDFLVCLLKEVCTSVQAEPHLTNLSGEELFYDTTITGNDARLAIKAPIRSQPNSLSMTRIHVSSSTRMKEQRKVMWQQWQSMLLVYVLLLTSCPA